MSNFFEEEKEKNLLISLIQYQKKIYSIYINP